MDHKKWVKLFAGSFLCVLLLTAFMVVYLDPFMHYHKPLPSFYYVLDRERYQNDGIMRHFDYDAIITGTSMTENFRTTEMDSLFDVKAVKVPFSAGRFKEINDNVRVAYRTGHKVKYVVRSLDPSYFFYDKDAVANDLVLPDYLYNDNIVDDVKYIFNFKALSYCFKMLWRSRKGGGITSFDDCYNWDNGRKDYGRQYVMLRLEQFPVPAEFGVAEQELIKATILQNVADLPAAHPETKFYYFIPPYSCVCYSEYSKEELATLVAAEKFIIEMLLPYDNIKLFAFDLDTELTNDLNNYKDAHHYGPWVNSAILRWMKEGRGLITKDNYLEYLQKKEALFQSYSGKQY